MGDWCKILSVTSLVWRQDILIVYGILSYVLNERSCLINKTNVILFTDTQI